MADRLLADGIYVRAFSFPVVPRGKARIRTQMSAAHTREDLDRAIAAFERARGVLSESSPERRGGQGLGTISLPSGIRAIGISLKFAMAIGMPMMVMHKAIPGDDVGERDPPAGDDQPDDVSEQSQQPRRRPLDHLPTERPGRVVRHPEGGDAEGDGDDQDATDDPGQHVGDPQPQTAEDEPDDVEQRAHGFHGCGHRHGGQGLADPGRHLNSGQPALRKVSYAARSNSTKTHLPDRCARRRGQPRGRSARRRPSASGRCRSRWPGRRPSRRRAGRRPRASECSTRRAAATCPWSSPRSDRPCGSPNGPAAARRWWRRPARPGDRRDGRARGSCGTRPGSRCRPGGGWPRRRRRRPAGSSWPR